MTKSTQKRWVDYLILGLSVFLVFCLLFESYMELPAWVSWLGRWHPLVLHFPIVLLLIAIFLGLTGKNVPKRLLIVAVVSALITAISGFFLGKDTLVKGDLLVWHQWLGGALALLSAVWYAFVNMFPSRAVYQKAVQVVLIGLIGFTGHYGGMVTHGADFLAFPQSKRQDKMPENPNIYSDVVMRILDNTCVSCHNPNKQKGELWMTSLDELFKGGEHGPAVVPGDLEKSLLVRRVRLPKEDEDHMPPEGKTPLSELEINILERWIALGAPDTVRLDQLEPSEPLVGLIQELRTLDPEEKWRSFASVVDSTLQNLSSDYLTIERMAANSNALSVDVYAPPTYDPKPITDLKRVANNLVELDVSGLPVGTAEMATIASCTNLEWLEIDGTPLTDEELQSLTNLQNLTLLKVYQTGITDRSVEFFKQLPKLSKLYIWDTNISEAALEALQKERPALQVYKGIDPKIKDFFVTTDSTDTSSLQ
ncbi:c-type cytochrome domain-containing protein [Maribacter aurantiacus]|uniref:Cytochrome C Planctomycete-type domain-containing protein n=1 Tax=Maribacter aurantiacus TaxID=1882343 RepID=A0A5R8MAI3_9FLAO|nr:c-type cytochrome domain-containing protein [Maribacter aurantiacus]TLF46566.1 hypothetical protein FEK29_01965 [Maribacter aurantiacus]